MNTTITAHINSNRHIMKLHPEIAQLRQQLKQLHVWPEGGDQYLALLAECHLPVLAMTDEDKKWLHLAVQDALEGLDIGSRYPAFFQKLLVDPRLRQSFLKELAQR